MGPRRVDLYFFEQNGVTVMATSDRLLEDCSKVIDLLNDYDQEDK